MQTRPRPRASSFITVPAVTFLAGWLVYREHPGGREQQAGR